MENQIHHSLVHENSESNHLLNSQSLIEEELISGCVKREGYTEEGDLEELVSFTTAPRKEEERRHTSSNINSDLKRRQHKISTRVETAAATSTTSFQDDEERLQMQKLGRGRKISASNDVRPPSCGTPLGKIKEEGQGIMKNSDAKENLNQYDFDRPSDQLPGNSNISNSNLSDNGEVSFNDRKLVHPFSPHAIRNSASMFDSQQPLHNPSAINGSPLFSDVSLIPLSPQPMVPGGLPFNRTSPLELYLRGLNSPTMSMISQGRNISPRHSIQELEKLAYPFYGARQDNIVTGNALSNQGVSPLTYYQLMQQQRLLAAAAENRNLAMSIEKQEEMARFASPFGRSRKRPLSKSPSVTDSMDLTAMIRTSPNSLLPLVNGCLSNSRSSSVASGGSYGHLAAGGISPTLGYPMMTSPSPYLFQRHPMSQAFVGPMIPNYNRLKNTLDEKPIINPLSNNLQRISNQNTNSNLNYHPPVGAGGQMKNQLQVVHNAQTSQKKIFNNMDHPSQHSHYNNNHNVNRNNNNMNMGISPASHTSNHNDENEVVYETNCNWENCANDFDTPEQLVQHINNDHIHGDKKEFVCRWRNCAREQRPFKAQYMLVVHMRRHTGEKPHRCTFTGCNKAYSRLENLKTHLRSHTGEKPYVCEYTGCTKAFSNASDRAKHQNRTHSNAKPYACKISGCTKCYTDPSSLRKHVKTVHGPEAHVTKRMRAEREREEKINSNNKIKQEPGTKNHKKSSKSNNNNCLALSPHSNQHHDNNPNNMNPRSNQSTCTSGSDVSMTPQNSPNMTSQNNNDSGVDVNVGGNEGDSDGDIVVDENPLPDSTSGGGVGVQSRRRSAVKRGFIPTIFNKKMQNLNISGINRPQMGDFLNGTVEDYNTLLKNRQKINRNTIGGGVTEVSSTTTNKNKIPTHHPFTSLPQDRRDSGAISDASRKSSMTSQTSRRSSQVSNARVNVVGSYDPISLDGSRRTSSISQGVPHPGSNPQAIDPNDLHFLRSQFNERMGMPPPTPIDRDSYSKTQLAKWLNEDQQQCSFSGNNPSRAMLPPQPPFDPNNRRCSDGNRQQRNSMAGGNPRNGYRRASDPVSKVTQDEPGPSNFQRYNSWNNVAPLPGIRNQNHSGGNQFGPHYNPGYQNSMQIRNRSDSNGSFYSSESGYHSNGSNLALNHHQTNYAVNRPQGGVNEQRMMENMNADIAASNARNEMAMRHFNNNCAYPTNYNYQDNTIPPRPPFNGPNNQNPAVRGHGMSLGPQNMEYYNSKHYREANPQMYRQPRQMSTPNIQQQQMMLNYQQQPAANVNPVSVGYNQQGHEQLTHHYNNPHGMNAPNLTPRPPPSSNHATPTQNQMRLARIRSSNAGERNVTQRNRTPEVQIPEEFLQQDFIESLTAPQPNSDFNANENASYVKMPADSTTGPDGNGVDNTDGAESTVTNTDVTLPSMSAFSSRLTTPVMNKPYASHHSMVNGQHPSSNMAINSMSSMLSALEEENKYLFPQ